MAVREIENAIADIFSTVTAIAKVYYHPVTEIGRQLPALIVQYNGFEQDLISMTKYRPRYRFEISLFLPAESKTLESAWNSLKDLTKVIMERFRSDPQLRGTCLWSILELGEPIISATETPHVGHTFRLVAEVIV